MISKIFNYIEKAVAVQQKQDKMFEIRADEIAQNKNSYMEDMINQAELALQVQQHKAAVSAQIYNQTYATSNTSPIYIQSGTGTSQTTGSVGNQWWITSTLVGQPSGYCIDVRLIDAHGNLHDICVDANYADLINQISAQHQHRLNNLPKSLPDPEFDLDEMAEAEKLLETMDGPRP